CDKWLKQQLAIIDPPVIVTLGRFSMAKFFAGESISRIHGQPRRLEGRTIVPMYHPAAALHQERLRSLIVDDFKRLPEILQAARRDQAAESIPTASASVAEQGRLF